MSRTILLADDSLAIQKVVRLTFETTDFDVEVVSSGDEALLELSRLEPAVVIADVHMPGASGYEVARRVKAERPGTPVLLLVGTFEAFDEEESIASGADEHMLKPFESAKLRERVEALARAAAPSAPQTGAVTTNGTAVSGEEPAGAADEAAPSAADESDDDTRPVEVAVDTAAPDAEAAPDVRAAPDVQADQEEEAHGAAGREAGAPEVVESTPGESISRPAASRPETRPVDTVALDADTVDRIARRVVELISADRVEQIAREVVPHLAEDAVRRRIEELERDVD